MTISLAPYETLEYIYNPHSGRNTPVIRTSGMSAGPNGETVIAGPLMLGNTTNHIYVDADGKLSLVGTATVWDDVYPSSVTVGPGASAPSFTVYNGNLKAYEFLGTGSTTKDLNIGFQFYHAQKVSDTITLSPHLHLYIPDNASGGTIKFYCEYTWAGIDQAGAITPLTISGTVTRTANQGINNNAILEFTDITGTGKGISSVLMCRIYRDPADSADTFAASVWLKSADVHIEKSRLGSDLEYSG